MKNIKGIFLRLIIYISIFSLLFLTFSKASDELAANNYLSIDLCGTNMGEKPIEIFYKSSDSEFTQDKSIALFTENTLNYCTNANIPMNYNNTDNLRIDLGDNANAEITIKSIEYYQGNNGMLLLPEQIESLTLNNLEINEKTSDYIKFISTGNDPFILIENIALTPFNKGNRIFPAIFALLITLIIFKFVKLREIINVLKEFYSNRKLIKSLTKNDFKTRFAGSYFGIIWAYIQPICTILVFWFVFQVGFRNPDVGNVEFILWFMTGLIPWFFFSEAWNSATNAFIEYSYLVKKVVFKINILPLIKIFSSLIVHFFFVIFMIVVYMLYHRFPTVYYLQLIYYMLCMLALVISLSFITAPLIIFFRDLGQIMNIVLQFGMWLTPIMWSVDNLPANMGVLINLFKLNPMYYIVQGYRNSMIYNQAFYDDIILTIYFWSTILIFSILGNLIYKKLKPHFADVL